MLIKIRNSLAISGIRCRIFKNQPPQTHKSPLVGWSKLIFNTFTSPQGGAKLLLLGEKLSSHFTVHSHFTAPKPRCSSWGISYLHASGTISSQKSASSRDGSTQRRADDAKSVTQPSARSQCSTDDATVEKFGKISHWAKAYFMEGGWTDEPPAVSLRAASKTLDSFNRSIVTQDTRKPKSLARVAWIVLFRGASAHLKIKERTRFHMVMVKKRGALPDFFLSRSLWYSMRTLRNIWGQPYSCGQCSETALNRSRRGAFRSSCGAVRACSGWHPSRMLKGCKRTECLRAKSQGLVRSVGMNQVMKK